MIAPDDRRTAVVVLVPGADRVVRRWRDRHDPHAAAGVPAHVTVLYPWIPADALTAEDERALAALAAAHDRFALDFAGFGTLGRTLWLAPSPAEPVVALTRAVAARWPQHPPYRGRFDGDHPHLTIADGADPVLFPRITDDVGAHLPLRVDVTELTLVEQRAGGWRLRRSFPLGTAGSPAGR
ncbi:hypothetical protein Athai_16710 [Actinocatenispora thailandica]|uniref:2'-5' RNA ligase family protein n=1 Tax=Actinocatenispora thailandica TaxID=227318 RepID=A0A7R7DM61_9ACTN|nr:2'-5' RNA ligase family protein [Actinocatenispora thailandica]BCJ34168.1 hypothetical protein Athai_16710 [Actinocatenispora thailandica]